MQVVSLELWNTMAAVQTTDLPQMWGVLSATSNVCPGHENLSKTQDLRGPGRGTVVSGCGTDDWGFGEGLCALEC